MGDKAEIFVEIRRSLLERFIRECGKYEFLIESKEFKIFSRQGGEVDEVLYKLPRQSPMQILEKYRLNFKIVEEQENSEITGYREKINVFNAFLSKSVVSMNADRKAIEAARGSFAQSYEGQKKLYGALITFEDTAVDYYADGNLEERLLTHPGAGDMRTRVDETVGNFRNPYVETALWIKGELLDIQGMIDALKGHSLVLKRQIATEDKRRENQEELEKLSLGKKTFKSFFMSKEGREKDILRLQGDIEQANVDIEDFRKLINFITVYLGALAIDKFQKDKVEQYAKMLNLVGAREVANSYLQGMLAVEVLGLGQ